MNPHGNIFQFGYNQYLPSSRFSLLLAIAFRSSISLYDLAPHSKLLASLAGDMMPVVALQSLCYEGWRLVSSSITFNRKSRQFSSHFLPSYILPLPLS
jgi:hypothetical protein